jgi:hypothetical protein
VTMSASLSPSAGDDRRIVDLTESEALDLLAAAPFGRVVFTLRALPMIRTVNHLVDDDEIVIRTRLGAPVTAALADLASEETVVAYQVDDIDASRRLGWSVVATGVARPVTDPARLERLRQTLVPWVDREMNLVIAIRPEIVTGIRLVDNSPA